MVSKSIGEHKKYLEGILHKNKDLFAPGEPLSVKKPGRTFPRGYVSFQAPFPYTKGQGMRLRGGRGSVAFTETWCLDDRRRLTKRVDYSYGLWIDNWLYSLCCDDTEEPNSRLAIYNFRYEQHEREPTLSCPSYHLHAIHSEPHYCARKMEFQYFIDYIRANFFEESGEWDEEAIWLR